VVKRAVLLAQFGLDALQLDRGMLQSRRAAHDL
jgi:hypothetical protein